MVNFCYGILFIFLIPASGMLFGQTHLFENYTARQGLLSEEIYNIHQDQKGYLWVFSNYGTMKYNGTGFKQVLKNLTFNESFIYCIYENKKGQKWVANSNAHIYEVTNDSAFIVKGTEGVSEILKKSVHEIYQLFVDDSLNIYATTKAQSYKFTRKGNIYRATNLSSKFEIDSIGYKVIEKDDVLFPIPLYSNPQTAPYFFSDKINLQFVKGSKRSYLNIESKGLTGPKHFKRFGKDIYFTFHSKLVRIGEGNSVHYISFSKIIQNFTKDKNNHLWVACYNNGLFELNEKDSIINHYFGNVTINDVMVDSQNGLWASSTGKGLYHCENLNNLHFNEDHPLGDQIGLIKKIGNKLFIANSLGDVFEAKYSGFICFKKSDNKGEVFDMISSGSDYLLSFRYNVELLDSSGSAAHKGNYVNENIINAFSFIPLTNDSLIYLHRRGLGLVVNKKIRKWVDLNHKTYSCEYRDGILYVGTDNGVFTYHKFKPSLSYVESRVAVIEKDSLIRPDFLMATKNSIITKVIKDPNNNLWFCSKGNGLFKLTNRNEMLHFSVVSGLPSDIIHNISFNEGHVILLSTNKGLFVSETGDGARFKWKRIYTDESESAILFKNNVYVGTSRGLVVLDFTGKYREKNINFNLGSLSVNSNETNINAIKKLDHNQNNLEFKFDMVSFSGETFDLNFHLYGPMGDSGITAYPNLNFRNLSPGSYSLVAFPVIKNGPKLAMTIPFTVLPAFWQTLWFRILFFMFLFLILGGLCLLIFRAQKKKKDKKLQAERLITEYKLVALKAQINPHFMSNCLASIQNLILNNNVLQATDYISRFGLFVRYILNFSNQSLIPIQEELKVTTLYLELEQLRFENKFIFKIQVDENIDIQKCFVPALILNPIIENSIWHGISMLPKNEKGIISIKISKEEKQLIIAISDNGAGLKMKTGLIKNTKDSKGIQLTEQRLRNINYQFNTDSAALIYKSSVKTKENPYATIALITLPNNLEPLHHE